MGMFGAVNNFFVSRNMCLNLLSYIWVFWNSVKPTTKDSKSVLNIDLKRITRCKLALIFTSADHRKFLGLFGSEAARL